MEINLDEKTALIENLVVAFSTLNGSSHLAQFALPGYGLSLRCKVSKCNVTTDNTVLLSH